MLGLEVRIWTRDLVTVRTQFGKGLGLGLWVRLRVRIRSRC